MVEQKWKLGRIEPTIGPGRCSQGGDDSGTNIYNITIVNSTIQCLALLQHTGGVVANFDPATGECARANNQEASTEDVYIREGHVQKKNMSICDESWDKLFEVEADGRVLYGTKAEVSSATLRGDDMRIHLPPDLYLEVDDVITKGGVICTSSVFVLSKSSWDTFEPSMYWEFVKVCDHGKVHWGKVNLGEAENPTSTSPTETHSVWFSRRLQKTASQMNPVYCNHGDGSSACGYMTDLFNAAEKGADIRMVENPHESSNFIFSADRVEFISTGCGIASQSFWRVTSKSGRSDFSEWDTQPFYWYMTLSSSFGSREVSRPHIGADTAHSQRFSVSAEINWFVDYCWILSFSHGNNGDAFVGSKQELIDMIRHGRKVRIMFDGYVMDADNIIINNDSITAQLLSQAVSESETIQKEGAVISKLVRISTSGEIYTDLYQRGTSQNIGQGQSNTAASWFVDTRNWGLVLTTDSSGSAIEGTKSYLLDAVRAGSRLRCIVKLSPTEILSVTVDNIQVNTDGNIAAQFFRLMEFDDNDPSFIPFWRILILTTNGEMKETRWTLGEHEHRGDSVSYVDIEWFVD
ncbi:uncharacterized protein [Argopecten irradians]|uniref:uncharacterized protein n=1 Tax=Argopecten irradians TaxID=31199 RepID=UPI0037100603